MELKEELDIKNNINDNDNKKEYYFDKNFSKTLDDFLMNYNILIKKQAEKESDKNRLQSKTLLLYCSQEESNPFFEDLEPKNLIKQTKGELKDCYKIQADNNFISQYMLISPHNRLGGNKPFDRNNQNNPANKEANCIFITKEDIKIKEIIKKRKEEKNNDNKNIEDEKKDKSFLNKKRELEKDKEIAIEFMCNDFFKKYRKCLKNEGNINECFKIEKNQQELIKDYNNTKEAAIGTEYEGQLKNFVANISLQIDGKHINNLIKKTLGLFND